MKKKRPHQQLRGTEPPGYIHLPKLGLIPNSAIAYFVSESQYCRVYFIGSSKPRLLSEPLAYFRQKLPHFGEVRFKNTMGFKLCKKLINPALPAVIGIRPA